jgi:hypothetical protein
MRIENKSARLVHLNLGTHVVALVPLKEETLQGDDAARAKAVLEGPFASLVDSGELVVDGKPKATPPSIEPSQPPTGAPAVQTGMTVTAPSAASDLSEPPERDTDPIPPAQQPPSSKKR